MSTLGTRDALVLVGVGGAVGTFARWMLAALLGSTEGLSAGIVLANVVGAGALGYLFSRLTSGTLAPRRVERLNLFLGVGILGGFTTYSTLAVHGAQLLESGDLVQAVLQVGAQVLLGVGAALAGLLAGVRPPSTPGRASAHEAAR